MSADPQKAWTIYVIGASADGPFKIGKTRKTAKHRLTEFQTGSPQKLTVFHSASSAHCVEATVHYMLRAARLRGEWFDVRLDRAVAAIEEALAEAAKVRRPAQPPPPPQPPKQMAPTPAPQPPPPIIKVSGDLVHRITIDEKLAIDRRIQYERNAPKRALVARLAAGKKKAAERRAGEEQSNLTKLQSWLNGLPNRTGPTRA